MVRFSPRFSPAALVAALILLMAPIGCWGQEFYASNDSSSLTCGECTNDADCARLSDNLPDGMFWKCYRPDIGGVCLPQGDEPPPVCEAPPYDCAETLDCTKLYPGDPPGGSWYCAKAPNSAGGICSVAPTPADPQIPPPSAHAFGIMRCDEYDAALMLHACGAFMNACNDPVSLCADPLLPVPVARAAEVLHFPDCAPTSAPACDFTAYGIATWITIDCCPAPLQP
jgi:hypothetical protein